MTARKVTGIPTAFLVAALVVSCASGTQTGGGADTTPQAASGLTIRVDNNRPAAGAVVVFIEPEAGVRRQLGEVEPGATGSFTYEGNPGNYRLFAQGVGGSDLRSESFRIFANTGLVTWNMSSNSVLATTRR